MSSYSSSTNPTSLVETARTIVTFIVQQRAQHDREGPLMVSMQGPQGAGKSTLARIISTLLREEHSLICAVASLDDFYLDHQRLKSLAQSYPSNRLLNGRGQPGTHDVSLLSNTLRSIRRNQKGVPIQLPIFDKSLYKGEGDRSADTISITDPLDVFILEGWSMGFKALVNQDLTIRYDAAKKSGSPFYFLDHTIESLQTINENLRHFANTIYPFFDAHVSLRAQSLDYIFDWRLQQEHAMKAQNGGKGMSDEQVRAFVERYMPGYELFMDSTESSDKRTLVIVLDKERQMIESHIE